MHVFSWPSLRLSRLDLEICIFLYRPNGLYMVSDKSQNPKTLILDGNGSALQDQNRLSHKQYMAKRIQ